MNTAGNAEPALGAAEDASGQVRSESNVMDGSASSKVTVEYHDPSGLYPLILEQLSSRLPLRNLHWKSPNRPLRSIDSLHVDLVPSKDSLNASQSTLAPGEAGQRRGSAQGSSVPSSSELTRPARRHQIPGLRQTPYLKIYLLRCDDSDTYKNTSRKQLREWVKANTPPSQSSSSSNAQDNHDAFEWLILHVVLRETPGSQSEKSSSSRWGRGSSTILEKIRADFNISSQIAPDRVAQIRLQKDAVPPGMLPTGAGTTSPPASEGPQEQNAAWADVIAKFKILILLSFDLRVSQYEEDIREKDSQRALPGWNFCTFFILKEGLARALESVGLVEDALVGYDELSVGLDSIVRDQAIGSIAAQGNTFLGFTEDVLQELVKVWKESEGSDGAVAPTSPVDFLETPVDSNKKNYRDLILSNNISIFDFRCYIFSRQMALLLRLGNARSSRSELTAKLQGRPSPSIVQRSVDDISLGTKGAMSKEDTEDLLAFAELCYRALNFITFAARLLRQDLLEGVKSMSENVPSQLLDNLVSSWTFAAAQQILDETATPSLPVSKFSRDSATGSSGKMRSFGKHAKEQKSNVPEPKTMLHPARSSSLSHRRSVAGAPQYEATTGEVVYDHGRFEERLPSQQNAAGTVVKSGVHELAANRAQLYVIQRRLLEQLGSRLGWHIGWSAILSSKSPRDKDLSEVDLEDSNDALHQESDPNGVQSISTTTAGIRVVVLRNAMSTVEEFRTFYEALSDLTVQHYMAAGQTKSGESILGDIAALRFELGDYAAAAMYFSRMAPLFAESRWNYVETTMLRMYAQCLKKLNRKDDYTRTLLDLLAKSAAKRKSVKLAKANRLSTQEPLDSHYGWLDDDKVDTAGLFQELISFSQQLPYDITVQMSNYFGDVVVEPYVRHYDDKDGFQLRLQFRHVLEDDLEFQKAKVRLISATAAQGKEIWLESSSPISLKRGICRLWLESNVNTTGPYIVDKILLQANKIIFSHEPFKKAEVTTPLGISTSVSAPSLKVAKKSRILCFPRTEAFQAKIILSRFIHIDKPRSIEIECASGWNGIERAEVRIRSASAGLRLRTANATVTSGVVTLEDKSNPGVISVTKMDAGTMATLRVPYETETILPELLIKLEVEYFTEKGQFHFFSSCNIPIELPLDVNVHDHFKSTALFSKFNIKTANNVPLEVLDVGLEGSEEFDVPNPRKIPSPTYVFPKQPISVTYKITANSVFSKSNTGKSKSSSGGSLPLMVDYRCLDEDIRARIESRFASAIENSSLYRLGRLIVPFFADMLEHRILPAQYEKICLLDEVNLGSFDDMGWHECIESLPHIVRDDTRKWLRDWHNTHQTISLLAEEGDSDSPSRPFRRIIITVAVPRTPILQTASLILHPPTPQSSSPQTIATVGNLLPATLRISHTRRWAGPDKPSGALPFTYSIDANPETWLIAGQRRAHFTANEDEEMVFEIALLPLKSGCLMLPVVNVERVKEREEKEGGKEAMSDEQACETDYLSHGETVLCIPDFGTATVGIADFRGGQAVLLGSEGRVEM